MNDHATDAWEYQTLRVPRGPTHKESADPEKELNELGADGWELTETIDYVGGGTKFLVFRRSADRQEDDVDESAQLVRTNESGRENEEELAGDTDVSPEADST